MRAGRTHQGDLLGLQPPGDEREHLGRGVVEPLRVVDQAGQRAVLGRLGQQRQVASPTISRSGAAPADRPNTVDSA
ncbi:hypothetical protein [Actinoplanes sp. NPDC089786]|uniref:hypothetical protein n=1 Tax=Actinoplanes sp. NPDC089786 TaxID=3155185 RepID=UPI0034323687